MALPKTTLETVVIPKYMKTVPNGLFRQDHLVMNRMINAAETFNGYKFEIGAEYMPIGSVQVMSDTSEKAFAWREFMTRGYDEQKTKTIDMMFTLNELSTMNSPQAVESIMTKKTNNVIRNLRQEICRDFWKRVAKGNSGGTQQTNRDTNDWNNAYDIIYLTTTLHNINPTDITTAGGNAAVWQPQQIDATSLGGSPQTHDGIMDSTSPVYLERLIQRGLAKVKPWMESMSDIIIVMGPSLFDDYATILSAQRRYKTNEKLASEGFNNIDYLGATIVPDPWITYGQLDANSNTDGWIAFFNMKHLKMNFNSSLKFANTGLVRPHNANYEVALINAKAQIYTDNRRAHCLIYNVWTEHDYSGDLEI